MSQLLCPGSMLVLRATLSRGCPGEPDDPICQTNALANPSEPLNLRQQAALAALAATSQTGEMARAQFSLYVMGAGDHMAEIMGCIDFLKIEAARSTGRRISAPG
jgi:hypothetical protein